MCREIKRIGEILAEHFPLEPDDTNELDDEVIVGRNCAGECTYMAQKSNPEEAVALNRISYWLMPVAEERGKFAKIITRLAGMIGGPVFAPHVTVYSGPAGPGEDPGRILQGAGGNGGELLLRCNGLQFSEKFTKACFLSFAPDPRLKRICEAIRENSCHSEIYHLKPHLSLFYGNLTRQDRDQIRGMIEIPDTFRFGGLTAMATSSPVRTVKDVRAWRRLESLRL